MDQYPSSPQGLDGDPYLREMQKRLDNVGFLVASASQSASNAVGGVAAQSAYLQQQQQQILAQQAYLNQIKSREYRIYANLASTDNSGSVITSPDNNPARSFSIDRPMWCRLSLRAVALLSASGVGGSGIMSSTVMGRIFLDGVLLSDDDAFGRASCRFSGPAGGNYSIGNDSLLVASAIVAVNPGDHVASAQWQFQGFGASVNAVLQNRTMTVDVLYAV